MKVKRGNGKSLKNDCVNRKMNKLVDFPLPRVITRG